jgi:hypothetical protein
MVDEDILPAEPAPQTGYYEELNVLGRRTGYVIHARKGEELPSAPRGFTWRPTDEQ